MVRHPYPQCLKTLNKQAFCFSVGHVLPGALEWPTPSRTTHLVLRTQNEVWLLWLNFSNKTDWVSLQGPSPSISSWLLVEGLSSYIIPGGVMWWGRSLNVQTMWVSEACCHSVPIRSLHLLANSPFPSREVVLLKSLDIYLSQRNWL